MTTEILKINKVNFHKEIIHTYPTENYRSETAAIFLNAGIINNLGPNRLYVRLTRKLSKIGIASVRFDYSNLSFTNDVIETSYSKSLDNDIEQIINYLTEIRTYKKFLLIGLCSGGSLAIRYSISNEKVVGIISINGYFFLDHSHAELLPELKTTVDFVYYRKNMFSLGRWRKIFNGESQAIKNILSRTGSFLRNNNNSKQSIRTINQDYHSDIAKLTNETKILLIFSIGDLSHEHYKKFWRKEMKLLINESEGNFEIMELADCDHNFSMNWAQQLLENNISEWLKINILEVSNN